MQYDIITLFDDLEIRKDDIPFIKRRDISKIIKYICIIKDLTTKNTCASHAIQVVLKYHCSLDQLMDKLIQRKVHT